MTEEVSKTELETVTAEAAAVLTAFEQWPRIVEDYLRLTQTPQTTFGKATGGGIDFVRHLRAKRDLRSSTVVRVLTHIRDQAVFA